MSGREPSPPLPPRKKKKKNAVVKPPVQPSTKPKSVAQLPRDSHGKFLARAKAKSKELVADSSDSDESDIVVVAYFPVSHLSSANPLPTCVSKPPAPMNQPAHFTKLSSFTRPSPKLNNAPHLLHLMRSGPPAPPPHSSLNPTCTSPVQPGLAHYRSSRRLLRHRARFHVRAK